MKSIRMKEEKLENNHVKTQEKRHDRILSIINVKSVRMKEGKRGNNPLKHKKKR